MFCIFAMSQTISFATINKNIQLEVLYPRLKITQHHIDPVRIFCLGWMQKDLDFGPKVFPKQKLQMVIKLHGKVFEKWICYPVGEKGEGMKYV